MNAAILMLVVCLTAASASPSKLRSKSSSTNSRVVGGDDAAEDQFPYIVSVRNSRGHHCGGSILNENWIITAAHCLDRAQPSDFHVVAGSHLVSSGGDTYQISTAIVHKEWDGWTMRNDIALLKLSSPIVFNDKVQPIPIETNEVGDDEEVVLCGWGDLSYGGERPDNLKFVSLLTIPTKKCAKGLVTIYESNICTFTRYGEGSCVGDSGGPLARDGKLVGIVSFGQPCAVGYPDAFTRVSFYASWIQSKMDDDKKKD